MNLAVAPSRLLAGRYHLEHVLGSGGMGVVYRARDLLHEQLGQPCSRVALKLLGESISQCPDAHVLLYGEFALARSLRHDRVVRVFSFEVDTHSKIAFFTMELLQGVTLDRLLLECPYGLPWQELQPIALQLLDALAYIHQKNVLHGDVKPANVMVGEEGVCLFDFGLGHAQTQEAMGLPSVSRTRFNAWTPAYAAPELLDGGALSGAADVYGMACIVYELASGQRIGARSFTDRLARPAQLPRHCWPALHSALAIDPQRRTVTVAELRQVMACSRPRWYL
ncbi:MULTISPECIES: serine/threonine-protein kinase [Pseudomonas]|uniref:Serine/threonine protein kinase n=1 Tax=Pseudomonas synxantha TaxID=47883 RepID=A0A5D3G8W1_9PSED|nr:MULTISPECIES: serine/threonine-protein kinase [Pseudomonas]KFF42625.1 serine/threonine protein kinase [Pseudomonas sp. BRG-100]MBY8972653.1 serine/threonine protein kinase [Pseudomonas sp. P867]MCK3824489.1 serine/threonine protein kinase [Pseudomonas sp. W2Aug9]MCK3845019.1 serine/threonine protein kinase [Pseudomonas sp. W15Feb34]MCK3853709.1 serine/threonine protein kinase [Pseudomonas sp. W2Jun17]